MNARKVLGHETLKLQSVTPVCMIWRLRAVEIFVRLDEARIDIDGGDEREAARLHVFQHVLQTLEIFRVLLRLLIHEPLGRRQTGADDAIQARATQRFEIRAVDEVLEVTVASEVRADKSRVADKCAAHSSDSTLSRPLDGCTLPPNSSAIS